MVSKLLPTVMDLDEAEIQTMTLIRWEVAFTFIYPPLIAAQLHGNQ
jgi:hypothetical protein